VVQTDEINDGAASDTIAELLVHVLIEANGQTYVNGQIPGGPKESSVDVNAKYIVPVRADTQLRVVVSAIDYDLVGGNDKLGDCERVFTADDMWGTAVTGSQIYQNLDLTTSTEDARGPNTIKTSFRISHIHKTVDYSQFRAQGFWSFKNHGTNPLSKQTFAQTFRDIGLLSETWDHIVNPFDALFYEFYKSVAKSGNCFGMATEALHALAGISLFAQHIYDYTEATVWPTINVKHGYQLSSEYVRWALSQIGSLAAFFGDHAFAEASRLIAQSGACLISLFKLWSREGHTMLAYACEQTSSGERRIIVADPNRPHCDSPSGGHRPWCSPSTHDALQASTFVRVDNGVTFAPLGYDSKDTDMLVLVAPLGVVAPTPKSVSGDALLVAALLFGVLGGALVMITGAAEVEQLAIGDDELFEQRQGHWQPRLQGAAGMFALPICDADDGVRMFGCNRRLEQPLRLRIAGKDVNDTYKMGLQLEQASLCVEGRCVGDDDDDTLVVVDGDTAFPQLSVSTTSTVVKIAKVAIAVQQDRTGRPPRSFELEVEYQRDRPASIQIDPHSDTLLLVGARKTSKCFAVQVRFEREGEVQIKQVQLCPEPELEAIDGDRVILVRPKFFEDPLGPLVLEELDQLTQRVLSRNVLQPVDVVAKRAPVQRRS
jgi:hypothetical protein